MSDRFLFLREIHHEFDVTVEHLREIAEAQAGCFTKQRFTVATLNSYPRFTKGPGGRWGIFESQLSAHWNSLRSKHQNMVDAQEKFRVNGGRR